MITMWTLYLLNVLFDLSQVIIIPIFFSGFLVAFGVVGKFVDEDIYQCVADYMKTALITLIVCVSVLILIPSKKEALAIYIIPKVLNNQQVQELPENALKYLNVFFKKEIAEITNGLEEK